MMVVKTDLDGDNVKDFAWCSSDDGTSCTVTTRGTVQSKNGCTKEENTAWIVQNAPQLFAAGQCVCECDKPRCYAGTTNSLLQATQYNSDGSQGGACALSLPGRIKLQRCCQGKIDLYKTKLMASTASGGCGIAQAEIDGWCSNVGDGCEVQIGGYPPNTDSTNQCLHQSTNSCAEPLWRAATTYDPTEEELLQEQSHTKTDPQWTGPPEDCPCRLAGLLDPGNEEETRLLQQSAADDLISLIAESDRSKTKVGWDCG